MIDTHVHVNTGGETPAERALIALSNAQIDLEAGFTTVLDMDSRGGYNTVELREAINAGLVQGPRMQVVGQSLNQRAGTTTRTPKRCAFSKASRKTRTSMVPGSRAPRCAKPSCTASTGSRFTRRRISSARCYMWKPDATLVASPSLTLEEVEAIVDEANRIGLKVACHTYGGEGMNSCIGAGVDAPQSPAHARRRGL